MKASTTSLQDSVTGFLFVAGCILFTVYGQLIVKWQVAKAGAFPAEITPRLVFLARLLLNPWVISGMAAGFGAMLCWLAAMTKFQLSYAYPFMSLAFVLVLILSVWLFGESLTLAKVTGVLLVILGVAIASRG